MDVLLKRVTGDPQLATYVDIRNRVVPCNPITAGELRQFWAQAPDSMALIATTDGQPVGYGFVEVQHWSPQAATTECQVGVLAPARGCGIGSAILATLSRWTAERGLGGIDVRVIDDDTVGFWERRGYEELFRIAGSQIDLTTADLPVAPIPDGVRCVSLRERNDLGAGVYAVACEAIADSPGGDGDLYDAGDFKHWHDADFGSPSLIDDCTIIALDASGTPIGYASLWRMEALPAVAHHSFTGVARAWRRRGVARALKIEQLRRARASGITAVRTENVDGNVPMQAINRQLGYRRLHTVRALRGPLAAENSRSGGFDLE